MHTLITIAMALCLSIVFAQQLCQNDTTFLAPHEIQGSERRSSFNGEVVDVEGLVSASFREENSLAGFFIQSLQPDDDPLSSNGLFIRLQRRSDFVDKVFYVGDIVRLTGTVLERNEQTQLDRLTAFEVCGYGGLPEATRVSVPHDDESWESFEAMLVSFDELYVSEVYNLGRYGEMVLSQYGRLYHPNNGQAPPEGLTNDERKLLLGDANSVENPEHIPYLAADQTVRLGDRVEGLRGIILNIGMGAYRVEPVAEPTIVRANPRPLAPDDVGGRLKVAGFNVLNFFTTLNERGADSQEEFERQEERLLAALLSIEADVFGLIELENNGDETLAYLTKALNHELGEEHYAYVEAPATGTGTDQIRQGLIYNQARLEALHSRSDSDEVHDRAPMAAVFRELATGEVFTVVVTHHKSKGGCPSGGDIDRGEGCWTLRRAAQSQASVDFAQRLADEIADPDVLIIGDINSYREETPVTVFRNNNYQNLDVRLPPEERYSYVFAGESGTLDYIFASTSLSPQVSGFTIWHINSDEPRLLDYNLEYNPPQFFRPGQPFRSSDHDPVIVGLELGAP